MRGLSALDVVIVLAVVALLVLAATRDHGRLRQRAMVRAATPPPAVGH